MTREPDEDKGPERTCVVTRRKGAPETMIRFVRGPEGRVVPDVRHKLPGRGVWVTAEATLVAKAAKGGAFGRGFKAKVDVPEGLADQVGELLAADALQFLSLANKAGAVVTGFAKVEAALAGGKVAALIHAREAGTDGVEKLEAAARRFARDKGGKDGAGDEVERLKTPSSIKVFASQQLDLALGRTNVIHAALAEGPLGEAFLIRCQRSILYRTVGAYSAQETTTSG